MRLVIHYRHPEIADGSWVFEDKDSLVVGRWTMTSGALVDVKLKWDQSASRNHALLVYQDGGWWVRDSGSRNGTFVDGRPVHHMTHVPPSSKIRVGDTELMLEYTPEKFTESGEGIIGEQMTIDPALRPLDVSETNRLDVLSRLTVIDKTLKGTVALNAVITEIRSIFGPNAAHVGILHYADKQILPAAFFPQEKAYYSVRLAQRAVEDKVAFIWTRGAGGTTDGILSLRDVVTAMYAPIIINRQVVGLIHVDATLPTARFDRPSLELLTEIAGVIGMLLLRDLATLPPAPTVFISYSRSDRDFVQQLASDLRKEVISVWYDERLRAGQDWQEQVRQVIESVGLSIFVRSPASTVSKNVGWEIDQIQRCAKPLIPLLLKACDLPPALMWMQNLHYIDFTTNYRKALHILLEDIRTR